MGTSAASPPMTLAASSGGGLAGPGEPVPVAFVGRTSTLELQNPVASLRRQVRSSQAALPPGWFIAMYFWDVESGSWTWNSVPRARPTASSRPRGSPGTAGWPTCSPRRHPRCPGSPR